MSFFLCKSTVRLLAIIYVLVIIKTFQMRYRMKFYLKGHQNYNMSKSKVLKKAFFIKENLDTVSTRIEPRGSIFQNRFLDGVQLKSMCAFIKICPFFYTWVPKIW